MAVPESEDRPAIGELFRRQERLERQIQELERVITHKLEETDRSNETRHQQNLALVQLLSKEFSAANQATYKELRDGLQQLDKRQSVAENTQKMTVVFMTTIISLVTTAILQLLIQFLIRR